MTDSAFSCDAAAPRPILSEVQWKVLNIALKGSITFYVSDGEQVESGDINPYTVRGQLCSDPS